MSQKPTITVSISEVRTAAPSSSSVSFPFWGMPRSLSVKPG